MMQMKRIAAMPMLVVGLVALLAGRASAAEPTANPLSVKKNTANAWQLKSSTFDAMTVRMTLGQINDVRTVDVPAHGRFLSLQIDGYVSRGKVGQPALPTYIKIIEIPQGAEPVVEILRDKMEIVSLPRVDGQSLPLYPMQAPVSKGSKPAPAFAYDKQAYAAKGYQAPELVRVEIMGESRGVRLAKLFVSPVEYEPVQNRLRIHTDLDFEIRFEGADYNATQAKKRRYHSDGFRVAEEAGVNAAAMRMDARAAKANKVAEQPLRYAIVADPKFKEALQEFIAWKRQQGFDVVEAYTSDEGVGYTADRIRYYLRQLYANASEAAPAPTYVLLVGDTKEIPPFDSKESYYNNHITDFYFVEYTNDNLPDAYLGRFSASTVEELMPQLHKTMYMSRLNEEVAGFVDTTLLVAGNDERFNLSHLNPALRYLQAYAAAEEGVTAILYPAPTSSTGAMEDEIIARISAGAGLVCYTGHGMEYEWCEPKISNTVLRNKISNKDKYPMMIGNCCLSGAFNYRAEPCFGEQLLRSADKGAVVYIGATNSSYFDEDFYWMVGVTEIDALAQKEYTYGNTELGAADCFYHTHGEPFSEWAVTASDIVYRGNMAVEGSGSDMNNYYWEIYELFGDPSYRPYKKKPRPTPIDCAGEMVVGTAWLSVLTAPYAQLSLYGADNRPVEVVSADANGIADMPMLNVGVGDYHLYAGAPGYTDNEIAIKATMPSGKFVFTESARVYDGDETVTEGVYGKRYGLSLEIKNIGTEAVNSIRVHLRSDDPYFVAGEDYVYNTKSEPGNVITLDKKLFFSVSPDVPNNHLLRYYVELTTDGAAEPMMRLFGLNVVASELQLIGMTIDDSASANPNGVLDGGETVKITLSLYNAGATAARDIKTTFVSERDYLILPEGPADWGTVAAGETVTREFRLGAGADKAYYDVYTVVCQMNADGRVQDAEVTSYIGPVVETFETGDFSFVAWDKASDWVISDSAAHGGKYCAASARIGDRDTSRLRLTVNVSLDDEVGFYFRTSTEGMTPSVGDPLIFRIDGNMMGRWNRENPWTYVSYPVSAGTHTLEWLYVKDASESDGADRVWIDDVRLPIGSHAPIRVGNEWISGMDADDASLFAVVGVPVSDLHLHFKVDQKRDGQLYILDVLGKKALTLAADLRIAEGESDYTFSVAGLKPGLYVCVFEGADGRSAVKFIKR